MEDSTNKVLISLVKEFVSDSRSYIIFYIAYLCIIPLKEVLLPHLFGKIVKRFQDKKPLLSIVVVAIAVWTAIHALTSVIDWQDMYFYPAIMQFIRSKTLSWIFETNRENYDDINTTETIMKMIKLPQLIYSFMDLWKKVFIPLAFTFLVAIGYITWQDPMTGGVLFGIISVYIWLLITSPSVCGKVSQEKDKAINEFNEDSEDTLRNMMAVLNTNNERYELQRMATFSNSYAKLCIETMMCIVRVQSKLVPCQIAFIGFAIWRCYTLMIQKKIDIGRTIAILAILLFLSNSLNRLTNEVRDLVIKHGIIKESLTVFEKKTIEATRVVLEEIPIEKDAYEIYVDDVTYRYKDTNNDILNNLTFGIQKGERVLIEGRIGTGKSTILKLIMRYKKPTSGMIYLNGSAYKDLTTEVIRHKIGYVPQVPLLFNRTIYDNIVYGSEGEYSMDDIYEVIDRMGLNHLFENFEQGLMTNVGKNGSKLSGGQRQIIWILRVLIQKPDIILLDEPTASIDDDTKETIYNLLNTLMRDKTVIMVTHDRALENHANRIITIKDGMIESDKTILS